MENLEEKENCEPSSNDNNNSDMSDGEISAMVDETVPAATKRSTNWGIKVFKSWQEKRNLAINLHDVSEKDLAAHLKKILCRNEKKMEEKYGIVRVRNKK